MPDDDVLDAFTLLGKPVHGTIDAAEIETFTAPASVTVVTFDSAEFTALCPVTGQPDLYRFTFAYQPRGACIESKSLKLYLHGFRNKGVFCERLAAEILHDLTGCLSSGPATIVLRQQVRGGLALTARADHEGGAM